MDILEFLNGNGIIVGEENFSKENKKKYIWDTENQISLIIEVQRILKGKKDILCKMVKTLERRGPDSEGLYNSNNVLLGHRRLIVVDPEGGKQPMIKIVGGKKYVIVYNGELYNTEDLRKELLEENFTFDSYSDTEVLLTSYIAWGIDAIKKLNGIFAFAIYDEDKQQVFLARDPMGVKPLFYSKKGSTLIFGSEIKTILAHPEVKAFCIRASSIARKCSI